MIKLKDILSISSAHEFKIKNLDTGKVFWNDSNSAEGYDEMLEEYQDYNVVGIKARSVGHARNNVKSILAIDIKADGLL